MGHEGEHGRENSRGLVSGAVVVEASMSGRGGLKLSSKFSHARGQNEGGVVEAPYSGRELLLDGGGELPLEGKGRGGSYYDDAIRGLAGLQAATDSFFTEVISEEKAQAAKERTKE